MSFGMLGIVPTMTEEQMARKIAVDKANLEPLVVATNEALRGLSIPQNAMFGSFVEGSEGVDKALAGQDYDFEDVRKAYPVLDASLQGYSMISGTPRPLINFGADASLDPVNIVGGGLIKSGVNAVRKTMDTIGDFGDSVSYTASAVDNFLKGWYGSPRKISNDIKETEKAFKKQALKKEGEDAIPEASPARNMFNKMMEKKDNVMTGVVGIKDKVGAALNFFADSYDMAFRSLSPEAIKSFKETGYNPLVLQKLNNFVGEQATLQKLIDDDMAIGKRKLESGEWTEDSLEYAKHKQWLQYRRGLLAEKNKQIEAQVQHATYTALMAGADPKDLPPLYKSMLDKMSVKASGLKELNFESYFETASEYSKWIKKNPQRKDVAKDLFERVLNNWGVKDSSKHKLIIRNPDALSPFRTDVQKVENMLRGLFTDSKGDNFKPFKNVDSLYQGMLDKLNAKNMEFIMSGLGAGPKAKEGQTKGVFNAFGVNFNDYTLRKTRSGVVVSIKGSPAIDRKEYQEFLLSKNAQIEEFNKTAPKSKRKNKVNIEEELRIFDNKKRNSKKGVISGSFLEGGVNMEFHITPKGLATSVISDDYNFLENFLPAVDEAFSVKLLGVTPPMRRDLSSKKASEGRLDPSYSQLPREGSLPETPQIKNWQDRNELIKQEASKVPDVLSGRGVGRTRVETGAGMITGSQLGFDGSFLPEESDEEIKVPYR